MRGYFPSLNPGCLIWKTGCGVSFCSLLLTVLGRIWGLCAVRWGPLRVCWRVRKILSGKGLGYQEAREGKVTV